MSKRQTICADYYKHSISVLKHAFDFDLEEISRRLRELGDTVSPDTLANIAAGKIKRTGPIVHLPLILFDELTDDLWPGLDVARDAFLMNEGLALALQQDNAPQLSTLTDLATSLYSRERPCASGFVAHVLDYLLLSTNVVRVTKRLIPLDDPLGADPASTAKCMLRRAARVGDAAIDGLRAEASEGTSFFLVRAVENRLVAAAELDELERPTPDIIAKISAESGNDAAMRAKYKNTIAFAERVHSWAVDLLITTASSVELPVVAWNAAELAGAAGVTKKAEDALEGLFVLRKPKDGRVALADDQPALVVEDYLAEAFAAALSKRRVV